PRRGRNAAHRHTRSR
uniref:Uncharacterized protein n=1 Tax=Setaria italica TaxID=4555 RepID=A0A0Q3VPQ9_SETIT